MVDLRFNYRIEKEHLKKGGLFDRWLVYDSEKEEHVSQHVVMQKLNEFLKIHPLFVIENTLSHEVIRILAKENLNDEAIHKFTVIKEEG